MARRHHSQFLGLVLFVAIATIVSATQSDWLKDGVKTAEKSQPGLYQVLKVIDGDTIAVDMNGTSELVRFIGVDTPETHKPNTPVQCYGKEAAAYTKQLIGSGRVRLQSDPFDTNRDRYGRLLRYIYLPDGTLVEAKTIQDGYGFAYILFPFEKKDEFKADMAAAESTKKGLWAACQVHQEPNGVYQTNPAN